MDAAGIRDVLTKNLGSTNPHNVVKATLKGLLEMRDAYTVARERGMSLVELFSKE
jgi:small subunit ribosomal protein S5